MKPHTTSALPRAVRVRLAQDQPWLWLNPRYGQSTCSELSIQDVEDAEARLQRFAPLLAHLFPELQAANGIIESALIRVDAMQQALSIDMKAELGTPDGQTHFLPGRLWVKADHQLPVAGSIKARGGIYEVLCVAERLALEAGLMTKTDDYSRLADASARQLFSQYTLSVGSTGNLGLSIGLMSAALGFKACVHMSVEAKQWKKDRLREQGVSVIEHEQDYSKAVAAGRRAAERDPFAYFVDDENSKTLFLGYSVAALRLQGQLKDQGIQVDQDHPLLVYIPCGVGGAPGGITFGLKQVFGEHVHCFFAEPTQAPCMVLGMSSNFRDDLTVYDLGLSINTEADGLAVGQASELVGHLMQPLLSGIFTVSDAQMFRHLYQLHMSEGLQIEPSAAAGFSGPVQLTTSDEGQRYLNQQSLQATLNNANHIVWTTGGCFVPEEQFQRYLARGEADTSKGAAG